VFLVGGSIAGALVVSADGAYAAGAVVAGVVLSWLSYRAAVTSARAYGSFLASLTQFAADGEPASL
jgi:poly(3-hydroxybutyrate) depolymerase